MNYKKEINKVEELAKLRVELRDKIKEKQFELRDKENGSYIDENEFDIELKSFVNSKLNSRKMKLRKFKTIALTTTLVAIGIGEYLHVKTAYTPDVIAIKNLETEIAIHGGKKDSDRNYMYDLEKHIESDKCLIPKEEGLSVQDRIEKYCNENEFSDAISDAAIAKFNCYYLERYEEGNKIDLNKIYEEEKNSINENKNENGLGM